LLIFLGVDSGDCWFLIGWQIPEVAQKCIVAFVIADRLKMFGMGICNKADQPLVDVFAKSNWHNAQPLTAKVKPAFMPFGQP
jgi:hypothetical protein